LDVKNEEAQHILSRLILEEADVLVQNLAPGAAARLGLSYEILSAKKPSLIVCDISGYGNDGPYRDKKAYDLLIQSESGFLSVTGTQDEPSKAGPSIADIAAGMYAYTNILSAILERNKTGQGKHIDISMLESLVEWMSFPLYFSYAGAVPPARSGANHATIYPYGSFPTGDGKTVIFGLQNEREWSAFCSKVLCLPGLALDPRFVTNSKRSEARIELRKIILTVFAKLTAAQVIDLLDSAQIANAKLNDMHEVWAHPQLVARQRWQEIDSPSGKLPALLPPGAKAQEVRMDAIPALGEHTAQILTELGYTAEKIEALREAQAI
jgi:crotonobetainyl-CoA:carnitine CoA-transferase CaiB-like acyl-CoA transferase